MTSTSAIVTSAALIGHSLAEDKSLATLPLAMQFIAVMAVTAPASLLMKRIGRRDGFTVGLGIGLAGAVLANYSKDLLPDDVFAGVYVMIAILYLASLLTLRFVAIPRPGAEERSMAGGRSTASCVSRCSSPPRLVA